MEYKKDYTSINIEGDGNRLLAAEIINDIPAMRSSLSFIYRVPDRLRALHTERYEPRIVSIGPFHFNKENMRITEEHKKWYLSYLITRSSSSPGRTSFQDIVKAIRGLELEARKCYAEKVEFNSDEFVKMMILDGCFILELLYKYREYITRSKEESLSIHTSDSQNHDPIFSATWLIRSLQRDLVLLENQIPFVVLETLFELTRDYEHLCSLNDLVLSFLGPELPTRLVQGDDKITGKHLLDFLRNHLLPSRAQTKCGQYPTWNFTQHNATDLGEAGVIFKKKKDAKDLFDITFTDYGVLEIPPFHFGEGITVLLPNLIALEQCHRYYTDHVTSYAILLDCLINCKEDVKLLRKSEIIGVLWNEDPGIANEISSLCKGVKIDEFYYDELCSSLNAYCRTKWNKWRAALRRNYFATPWAILSVIAAVVLLLLTFVQTLFSLHSI